MAEFGVSVLLEAEVDQASLRQARQEIEDGVPDPTVGGGGGGGGAAGGNGLGALASERNELLEDILDTLEGGGVAAGGGGGGGPGSGITALIPGLGDGDGAGSGFLGGLLGSGLASRLGTLGLGSRLSGGLLTTALTAQLTGAGGAGGVFRGPQDVGPGATAFGQGLNNIFGIDGPAPEGQAPIDQLVGQVSGLFGDGNTDPARPTGPEAPGPPQGDAIFGDILTQLSGVEIPEPPWLSRLENPFQGLRSGPGGTPGRQGTNNAFAAVPSVGRRNTVREGTNNAFAAAPSVTVENTVTAEVDLSTLERDIRSAVQDLERDVQRKVERQLVRAGQGQGGGL